MNNKQKKPNGIKVILKLSLFIFMLFTLVSFMVFTVQYATGEYDIGLTKAEQMDAYERCLREKNYSKLRDNMQLFDAYDEEFDIYWEAVKGYEDYMQYLQWSKTSEKDVAGSEETAKAYKEKVIDNAKNCVFNENKKQLEEYALSIK